MFTYDDLNKVLQKEPTLNKNGFNTPDPRKIYNFGDVELVEIDTAITWLSDRERSKRFNKNITSYGIKHLAERAFGTYICNGSLIAAAIHMRLEYEKIDNTPNIFLKIPDKELYRAYYYRKV